MVKETDYIKPIAEYFKKNLSKGYTIEALKWALINQGYPRSSVYKAADIANEELAKSAPKLVEKPLIKYEIVDSQDKVEKNSFWQKIKDFFRG